MLTVEQLGLLENFLMSDHVSIKGNEFMTLGTLIGAIQQHRAELQRAAALPDSTKLPKDGPTGDPPQAPPPAGSPEEARSRIREVK